MREVRTLNAGCWRRESRVARGTGMMGTSAGHAQSFFALLLPFMYLFIYLFIYLFTYLIAFTMITILKKTREKIHLNKTQKTKVEFAGHTTERSSKLSVPLPKIHKY